MKRDGFTLIELLVVLTVVLILFGVTFRVLNAAMENARRESTRSTILQLYRAISARRDHFDMRNFRSAAQTLKAQYDTAGNPAPNDKLPMELAMLLVKKNQFRAEFPQRLEDLFGIDGQPGTVDDSPLWEMWKRTCNDHGVPVTNADIRPAGHRLDLENSELLHLFLSRGGLQDGVFTVDRINRRHVRDANANGHPEIIDDWEQPIRFYNWPTRLVRPGGNGQPIDQDVFTQTARQSLAVMPPPDSPSPFPLIDTSVTPPVGYYDHPLNQDPDDPFGALPAAQSSGYLASAFRLNRTPFGPAPTIITVPPFDEAHYHTLDTWHTPFVVSAGPDGQLGLWEPTAPLLTERRNADVIRVADAQDNVALLP